MDIQDSSCTVKLSLQGFELGKGNWVIADIPEAVTNSCSAKIKTISSGQLLNKQELCCFISNTRSVV